MENPQNPPQNLGKEDFRVLITYPNLTMMLVPSLAIGIFTRILKKQKYQVDLFDTTHYVADENSSPQNRVKFLQAREFNETNDLGVRIRTDLIGDYVQKIESFRPHFIIYSVVEDCYRQTLALMEAIKSYDIAHIVGGVYPTAAPEVCINNELINVIGIGEGEKIIVDVAEAFRLGDSLDEVPGVWHKSNGKIVMNARGPLIDINKSVPDFSLFDDSRFKRPMGGKIFRTIPVETYRGCPFQCTYCNSPMQTAKSRESGIGNFLRRKDMKTLRGELRKLIKRYDPEFLYFIDDSFTARPKAEVFDFCDMYEEFKLPFWFNTRPETTNSEMMKRLKEVGAYRISFGIEAGNEQYREKVLRRKGSNDNLKGLFDMIAESGIPFSLNLIIGMPGETRELIMDTVHFTRTLSGYDTVTVSIFTPYYGTVLRDVAVKNGWLDSDYITKHTTSSSALRMPPPFVSSADIDSLMRVLPLYIYFPESEWSEIKRAEIDDQKGNEILEHYSEIYTRDFLKEDQFDDKVIVVDGATGCKSNPKDSFRLTYSSPTRFAADELQVLMMS
jgi:radical SAM superfamily enzyme YgiQ (UPF0313 family)